MPPFLTLAIIDPTISVGNIIMAVMFFGGILISVGMNKQRMSDEAVNRVAMEERFKEALENADRHFEATMRKVDGRLDQFNAQLRELVQLQIKMASQDERLNNQAAEMLRTRDRLHDIESQLRGMQARQAGVIT